MNTVNFQASVNNVTQMDRFQQDVSRTPVVNQDQNAVISQEEAERRIRMATQLEQPEGKKVEAQQRKNEAPGKRKKQKKEKDGGGAKQQQGKTTTGGYFVDLQA